MMTKIINTLICIGLCGLSLSSYGSFTKENLTQKTIKSAMTHKRITTPATQPAPYQILAENTQTDTLSTLSKKLKAQEKQTSDLQQQNMELKDSLAKSQKDLSNKELSLDEKDQSIQELKADIKKAQQALNPAF